MILIVDDDTGITETCAMFLEVVGFDVCVVNSGAEALARIKEAPPELMISDCAMPNMSGVELSEQVRTDPATAHVPILLMSASLRCDIADSDCYDAFLRKPFRAEHLLVEVRKLLAAPAPQLVEA